MTELNTKPEITMTIEEIKEATGTKMTIESLRERGYWNACREGRPYFDAQTNTGLWLQEHLDAGGKVFAVTYLAIRARKGAVSLSESADRRLNIPLSV